MYEKKLDDYDVRVLINGLYQTIEEYRAEEKNQVCDLTLSLIDACEKPRMSKKRKEEWALFLNERNRVVEVYDSDYSLGYMGFCGSDREFAEKVMDAAFGGTEEKRDGFYVSSPSLSRKTDVIPPLDNALNALTP